MRYAAVQISLTVIGLHPLWNWLLIYGCNLGFLGAGMCVTEIHLHVRPRRLM